MNTRATLQYGLLCLQGLDQHTPGSLSAAELSREQGVPPALCRNILECFAVAGIVNQTSEGNFALAKPAEDLTSLEIIEALCAEARKAPAFRMLYQSRPAVLRNTLNAVRWSQRVGAAPSDDGRGNIA